MRRCFGEVPRESRSCMALYSRSRQPRNRLFLRTLAHAVWRAAFFGTLGCAVFVHGQVSAVQDLAPLNPSSSPGQLTAFEDSLYFVADDGVHGREIWRYTPEAGVDTSAECLLVSDMVPGQGSANPERFFPAGENLYFSAHVSLPKPQPWMLHANESQPMPIKESTDITVLEPQFLDYDGRNVYMAASPDEMSRFAYLLPPGSSTAERLTDFAPSRLSEARRATLGRDGALYFYLGEALHRLSREQLVQLADFGGVSDLYLSGGMAPLGDWVIFVGFDSRHGREVWRTDGTPEGTGLLKDISEGPASSRVNSFVEWQGELYFAADDGRCGKELWKTNGTPDGTVLLRDHFEGPSHGDPHYFAAGERWLFYLALDENHGKELWRTDGAPENTAMVTELTPGPLGSDPWELTPFRGKVYFCANSALYGEEIFISDGTAEGTHILKDIAPGEAHSGPDSLTVLGDRLFFTCDDGIHGEELWVTDGTEEGTRLAADIYPIRINPSSSPRNLVAVGDRVFFTVHHQMTGEELWTSDGTLDGTQLVHDIAPGPQSGSPSCLTALGNRLYFAAFTEAHGCELWYSDGTLENTRLVSDLNRGPQGSNPRHLCTNGESLFFAARGGPRGESLWRYSPATAALVCVETSMFGEGVSEIGDAFSLFGRLYAYLVDNSGGDALCRVESRQDSLALAALDDDALAGDALAKATDSTASTAEEAALKLTEAQAARIIHPLGSQQSESPAIQKDGVLLCVLDLPGHGAELCTVSGNPPSIHLVRDIFPGPASSSPGHLCEAGGLVYFTAEHPTEGRILWKSDGHAGGTGVLMGQTELILTFTIPAYEVASLDDSLVVVSEPGRSSTRTHRDIELRFIALNAPLEEDRLFNVCLGDQGSWPRQLTRAGNRIFFTADDGVHGEELWVTDGTAEGTHLVKDILMPGDLSPRTP